MSWETELRNILKRLDASNTKTKRSNALRAFTRFVDDLSEHVCRKYPKLRKDGTECGTLFDKRPKGYYCPKCRLPLRDFKAFEKHITNVHKEELSVTSRTIRCWCGKEFCWTPSDHKMPDSFAAWNALVRHLIHVPDLFQHIAMGNWKGMP